MNLTKYLHCFIFLLGLLLTDAKIAHFWHITDLHYDPLHKSPNMHKGCKHTHISDKDRSHKARHRGHTCDSSWFLIQSAVDLMKNQNLDTVEFVLWTGDSVPSSMDHLSEEYKLQIVKNVTNLLNRAFSNHFVFPALGHTDPRLSKKLVEMWTQWLPNEALTTLETGGYYTIEQTHSKLRIVVLNSNLWSKERNTTGLNKSKTQWKWLEQTLMTARNKNQKIYIVGHAGPGVDEYHHIANPTLTTNGDLIPMASAGLAHLVRSFSDVIAGQFYGHWHKDTFRVFYQKGHPVSWAFYSPSVTPHSTGSVTNPGLRLYKFNAYTGQILDYTQFYLDVTGNRSEYNWVIEYNFTQHYGLMDISATSLNMLAERLKDQKSKSVLSKYLSSLRASHNPDVKRCNSTCANFHYCAITRTDYEEFKSCVLNSASVVQAFQPLHQLYAIVTILFFMV